MMRRVAPAPVRGSGKLTDLSLVVLVTTPLTAGGGLGFADLLPGPVWQGGKAKHYGRGAGVRRFTARNVVAGVTANDRAAEEGLGAKGAQGAVGLHAGKDGAAIV